MARNTVKKTWSLEEQHPHGHGPSWNVMSPHTSQSPLSLVLVEVIKWKSKEPDYNAISHCVICGNQERGSLCLKKLSKQLHCSE